MCKSFAICLFCCALLLTEDGADARCYGQEWHGQFAPYYSSPSTHFSGWYPTTGVAELGLYQEGVQIGSVRLSDGLYFQRIAAGEWRGPCECPVDLPQEAIAARNSMARAKKDSMAGSDKKIAVPIPLENPRNFGMRRDLISQADKFSVNGKEVSRHAAMQAIRQAGEVPDDSGKLSLTFIGSDEDCVRAATDLSAPQFAVLRDHVLLQTYGPEDVMVSPTYWGGPTIGNPVVILQKPDGKVLWCETDYRGLDTIEAVRRADPDFKPDKAPGPVKPSPVQPEPDKQPDSPVSPSQPFTHLLSVLIGALLALIGASIQPRK